MADKILMRHAGVAGVVEIDEDALWHHVRSGWERCEPARLVAMVHPEVNGGDPVDVPSAMVEALSALGWYPVDDPPSAAAEVDPDSAPSARRKKKEN